MKLHKEDFTEDELTLLLTAFQLLEVAIELPYKLNYDKYGDILFSLKEKLGIYELEE